MKIAPKIILGILILFAVIIYNSCDRPTAPPNPNQPPNTKIANIPKAGDTLFALATLHWDGNDNDGYVSYYQYRYVTYHLTMHDSLVQPWKDTKETSMTIAFVSDDIMNKQVFEVRAVDNNGTPDPTPATKIFYTPRANPPTTQIASPVNKQVFFAVNQTTDWWQGIKLTFSAKDAEEGGEVVSYAWAVDNGNWHWSQDTSIYITPDLFKQPLMGNHVIRVTSKNNTNLIDPIGDSVIVKLIRPTFTKKILIIDETDANNFPPGVQGSNKDVTDFYADIFPGSDSWNYLSKGMPPKDTLGQYKLVVWVADDRPSTKPHALAVTSNQEALADYLNVGGKFIMSGWRILKSFAWNTNFPASFPKGSFVHDYLHITAVDETVLDADFTGAIPSKGYHPIRVDSAKLAEAFPYYGKLGQINLVTERAGFTDIIYSYNNANNSQYVQYRGQAVGLRYYGTVYDAVILGFPIYFIQKDDAKQMVTDILHSLNMQ